MWGRIIVVIGGGLVAGYLALFSSDEPKHEGIVLSEVTKEFKRTGVQPAFPGKEIPRNKNSYGNNPAALAPAASRAGSAPGANVPCQNRSVQARLTSIADGINGVMLKSAYDRAIYSFNGLESVLWLKAQNLDGCLKDADVLGLKFQQSARSNGLAAMREDMQILQGPGNVFDRYAALERINTVWGDFTKQEVGKQILTELGFVTNDPAKEFKKMTDEAHINLGQTALVNIQKEFTVHPREGIIVGLDKIKADPVKLERLRAYNDMMLVAINVELDSALTRSSIFNRDLTDQLRGFFERVERPALPSSAPQQRP